MPRWWDRVLPYLFVFLLVVPVGLLALAMIGVL